MDGEPPLDYADLQPPVLADRGGSRRTSQTAVTQWLGETSSETSSTSRGTTRGCVSTDGLQLVAINLLSSENSQEIFETLNARGTPLTAADLVTEFRFSTT